MTPRTVKCILSVAVVAMLATGVAGVAATQNDHALNASIAAVDTVAEAPDPVPSRDADEPVVTTTPPTTVAESPEPTTDWAAIDARRGPIASASRPASSSAGGTTNQAYAPAPKSAPATTTVTTKPHAPPAPPSNDAAVGGNSGAVETEGDAGDDGGVDVVVDPPPTSSNVSCGSANGDGTGPEACTSSDGGVVPIQPEPSEAPTENDADVVTVDE